MAGAMPLPPLNLASQARSGATSGGINIGSPNWPAWMKVGQGVSASNAVAGVPDLWLVAIAGLGFVWWAHRGGKL